MIHWLEQNIYFLQIIMLLTFKSEALFHKLNQLDWYRDALHQWVDGLSAHPNARVLEIGCATGALCEYMDACGYITTGVDKSKAMINIAKTNKSGLNYREADAKELPFQDGAFDFIISASLFNIVSERQKVLDEMMRVCKSGGYISVFFPAHGFSDEQLQELIDLSEAAGFSETAMRTWHRSAPKMQVKTTKMLLEDAGLKKISSRSYLQGMVSSVTAQMV